MFSLLVNKKKCFNGVRIYEGIRLHVNLELTKRIYLSILCK